MKKIMLSAAVLAFAGMATVNAETIKTQVASAIVVNVQDKTPIQAEALPDAVKAALTGDDYSGWTIKEAFAVQTGGALTYEISLQKDDENRVISLNEAGDTAEAASTIEAAPVEEAAPAEQAPAEDTPSVTAPAQ
jgi:hypothetical protein